MSNKHSFLVTLVALALASSLSLVSAHIEAAAGGPSAYSGGEATLNLRMLPAVTAGVFGAYCLDGSLPGYYISEGSGSGVDDWVLFLEGGGWCYNMTLCYERAQTALGSSKSWGPTLSLNGIFSDDASVNQRWSNANKVHIMYCDGASFAGNRSDPVTYNDTVLYFRGLPILHAVIYDLQMTFGLNSAKDVILGGCSAGGLATYFHCDAVKALINPSKEFKCVSDSGFFLDIPNTNGEPVYPDELLSTYLTHGMTGGLNQNCVADNKGSEYLCVFAQNTYPYIKTPIFVFNSMFDGWQLYFIVGGGNAGGFPCIFDPDNCSSEAVSIAQGFEKDFIAIANKSHALSSAAGGSSANGAFIHSCLLHCGGLYGPAWNLTTIGGVTFDQALTQWYDGTEGRAASAQNFYVDCTTYGCNPSCQATYEAEGIGQTFETDAARQAAVRAFEMEQ